MIEIKNFERLLEVTEALAEELKQNTIATRTTAALLLAQRQGLDMTESHAAAQVLRGMGNAERAVRDDSNV